MVRGLLTKILEADIFKPPSAKDVKARDAEKEVLRKKERDEMAKTMFVCPYCDEPIDHAIFVIRTTRSVDGQLNKDGEVTDWDSHSSEYEDEPMYEDPECPDCGHDLSKDIDW
jgi:DNA-directed RNA polymerase subunit M/transcription elongation factor TFIIS